MPRIIEERWMEIGFDVITEQGQVVDPKDGQPLHDGKGLPITQELTTIVVILNAPTEQRIVRIPFNAEAKQILVQKLTHGIVVPGNGSAPHLPFRKGV